MKVLVAGAGINGVSTAIWLQRAGHEVVLVDREGPAAGTSYGNAGILAAAAVIPVTVPGLMRKVPKMLIDKNSPLFLRWSYLPKLLPFLAKYLPYGRLDLVEKYGAAMTTLNYDTYDQHIALAKGTGAEAFISDRDYCFGYASKEALDADSWGWDFRKKLGFVSEVLTGSEYSKIDPLYTNQFSHVVACKNHGQITDPGAYVSALCDYFVSQGGTLKIASVSGLITKDDALVGLQTDAGDILADKTVLTMGIWSGPLSKKLGLSVPLESERGYHIELVNPSAYPKSPVMIADGKFVITPMKGRIRLAGLVEFGGVDAGPSKGPIDLLKSRIPDLLPDITYDRIDEWMGHRPSPANSLPVIGPLANLREAYVGFGHQHLGLTGGPKTGRILADLISGKTPNFDLEPFSPDQYL